MRYLALLGALTLAACGEGAAVMPNMTAVATAAEDAEPAAPRTGLWPFVRGAPTEATEAAAAPARGGLFGSRSDGTPEVTPGTQLEYGTIATVCGLSPRDMGEMVGTYPEGRTRYTLYDSAPGSLNQRTHYLTGFKDGCARQFTAALALFGTPDAHEAIRYSSGQRHIAFTATDRAYEAIRARTCRGATVGTPCGRAERLNRETAFVSVYERFGTSPQWADILIHDGAIVAKDLKS
ncbi:MAG: hypothetical protein ACU0DW_00900 [Shimia sp.]